MITDKKDYLEFYDRDPAETAKEKVHQVDCVTWLRNRYPDFLFWHSVNENEKHIKTALVDQQSGLLKGVSDFVILIGFGGKYPFAAIELKRTNKSGKGKASPVSKEQKDFLRKVRDRGGFAAVAYGFEQFKLAVAEMMKQHFLLNIPAIVRVLFYAQSGAGSRMNEGKTMYILIMMLTGMGSNALATAEFSSKDSCDNAIVEIKKKEKSVSVASYICVKK